MLQAVSRAADNCEVVFPVLLKQLLAHPQFSSLCTATKLALVAACAQHCQQQDVAPFLAALQLKARCCCSARTIAAALLTSS